MRRAARSVPSAGRAFVGGGSVDSGAVGRSAVASRTVSGSVDSSPVGSGSVGLLAAALFALASTALLGTGCRYVSLVPRPELPEVLAPRAADDGWYVVQPGDDLATIAAWHGTDAAALARANERSVHDPLRVGERLRVPVRSLPRYTIQRGDTLSRLAQWYGVEVEALSRMNGVQDPRRLEIGWVLRIPATARRDDPPPPPRTPTRVAARSPGSPGAAAPPARRTGEAARPASGAPEADAGDAPATAATEANAAASDAGSVPDAAEVRRRAEIDDALDRAWTAFDAADFERTLALTDRARALLADDPAADEDRRRLARAELLRGMAQVALGDTEAALASFEAAIELDPAIELDDSEVSPKIVAVFREARARLASSRAPRDTAIP